jgi:hypothetical protein
VTTYGRGGNTKLGAIHAGNGRAATAAPRQEAATDLSVMYGDRLRDGNLIAGVVADVEPSAHGNEAHFAFLPVECDETGIAHRYEEFPDNHSGVDYRMDENLPFLAHALTG